MPWTQTTVKSAVHSDFLGLGDNLTLRLGP